MLRWKMSDSKAESEGWLEQVEIRPEEYEAIILGGNGSNGKIAHGNPYIHNLYMHKSQIVFCY